MKNNTICIILIYLFLAGCESDTSSSEPSPEQIEARRSQRRKELLQDVKNAIEAGGDVNRSIREGKLTTLLHECARVDAVEAAKLLLKNGADVHVRESRKATPLHMAVENCSLGVAQLLLDNGANIEARSLTGSTPMFYAVRNFALEKDMLKSVAWLIDNGAKINVESNGLTPLHYSIEPENYEMVKFLLDNGASVNYGSDCTPLHFAASYGCPRIAELLVQYGADVNAMDHNGETPLYHAINRPGNHPNMKRQKKVIKMIKSLGGIVRPSKEEENKVLIQE